MTRRLLLGAGALLAVKWLAYGATAVHNIGVGLSGELKRVGRGEGHDVLVSS